MVLLMKKALSLSYGEVGGFDNVSHCRRSINLASDVNLTDQVLRMNDVGNHRL